MSNSNPEHKHEPQFTLGGAFRDKPRYNCKGCDLELELKPDYVKWQRVLLLVLLVYTMYALFGRTVEGAREYAILLLVWILPAFLLFFLIALLMTRRDQLWQVLQDAEPDAEPVAADEPEHAAAPSADVQELIDLYKSYEEANAETQSAADAAKSPDLATEESPGEASAAEEKVSRKETAETCAHELRYEWRIFVPWTKTYHCGHCGEELTFKRKYTLIIDIVSLFLFLFHCFAGIAEPGYSMGEFTLRVLVLVAACAAMQTGLVFLTKTSR